MGVRSSCDASEVNCFSAENERSSLSNIPSKVFESAISSEEPLRSAMRRERSLPPFIESAVCVIFSTGSNARLDIIQPPRMLMISITGSSIRVMTIVVCAVPESSFFGTMPRIQTG